MFDSAWKVVVLCGLMGLSQSSSLWASEWRLAPTAKLSVEHNDNWLLVANNPESTFRETLDLGMDVASSNGHREVAITPAVRFYRYSSFPQYNDEVYSLTAGVTTNAELWSWSLRGDIARDSTLTTEYENFGAFEAEKRRRTWGVTPSLTYAINPRTSATMNMVHRDVSYEDASHTTLVDSQADTVSLLWARKYNERATLQASGYTTRQNAADAGYLSRDSGVTMGFEYDASELLKASVSGGTHKSVVNHETLQGKVSDFSRGWTYNANVRWHGLQDWWELAVVRSIEPGTHGVLMKQEQASFSLGHAISARIKTRFAVRGFRNTSLSDVITADNRTFSRADASINWAYTKNVDVAASVGRLRSDVESVDIAIANTATLSVSYHGDGLSWWQ